MHGRFQPLNGRSFISRKRAGIWGYPIEKIIKTSTGFGVLEVPLRARHAAKNYCPF